MHDTAYKTGGKFFEIYWRDGFRRVLDIGSRDVNGTLRDFCPREAEYVGVDMEAGAGVDIVLDDPYRLPFPPGHFDAIVSTSCFEHDEMFWLTFLECSRVLSDRGVIYINAPSTGLYHGYPGDQWRFYADAALALANWAQRMHHDIRVVESFITYMAPDHFNDCVMVFTKDPVFAPPQFLCDVVAGAKEIRKPGPPAAVATASLAQTLKRTQRREAELVLALREAKSQNEELRAQLARLRAELERHRTLAHAQSEEAARERDALAAEVGRWLDAVIAITPDHSPLQARRRRRPPSPLALAGRARDARRWELAVRYYRDALDHDPNDARIWLECGHALKQAGRPDLAEAAYRQALELGGRG